MGLLALLWVPLLWIPLLWVLPAAAGSLDRAGLEKLFPAPLVVGEKDEAAPVWPILKQEAGSYEVFAYAFESIDLAPIPGFGGTPPDLLIALAPDGSFRDVRVIAHHEPVFLEGLGEAPLFAFVEQYVGLSARRAIRVGRPNARAGGAAPQAVVDGVSMATASTRVINESILAASLAVARRKLGFGAAAQVGLKVEAKPDLFEPLSYRQLLERDYVKRFTVTNAEAEAAFKGTSVEGSSEGPPEAVLSDLVIAYLNAPSIGRNLLGEVRHAALMRELGPGDHAVMVVSAGPLNPLGDDFVLGSVPDRLSIQQEGLTINARDMAIERRGAGMEGLPSGPWTILRIGSQAGFDPGAPWILTEKIVRERGQILVERIAQEISAPYALPAALFTRETPDAGPSWIESWRARGVELGLIAASLGLLVPVLARQRGLVSDQRRFTPFRLAFLAFTLLFIGWYAQAQLSVLTLVGLVRAAAATHDLSFLLYDPPSLLLWGFVLATLVIWGRGTFCGWLCPFGALQELAAWAAGPLRIRQITVPPRLDRGLRLVKYAVLAGILGAAALASPLADSLSEAEPFKTAITLSFVRSSPFVLYAAGLIVLNLFVYKGFCRYLCPLGAGLALAGHLRILDWIPRRAECGSPCQLCKVRCRYGAIAPSGAVDYAECFQCMDCVTIIHDPRQCVPQVVARKRGRRLTPRPVAAE
ncbi:4Fe-4S binding protein [Methylobacterium planeticum]|uniref:4Fe-4S binding protein n=1 Tax=Methylobacterium planeticum TaxID=2615211 RepID=A0A6N6N0K2_9HYPH|nr:4Fe-4S binding protein [Methylobacterium planeticum]KAB1075785.1 4Fe-4S binding protein [Methylobacterium planeticum]